MKKRFLSTFMALLMVCSLVMYLPNINLSVSAVTQSSVSSQLYDYISEYNGRTATSDQMYMGSQCKGFANWIFLNIFDEYIGAYPSSANYTISNPQAETIGIIDPGYLDEDSSRELLQKAKPGDYIQVQRSIAKSNGKCGPHSMIVVSVESDGVNVLDCNSDGKNTIKYYLYTWSQFDYDNRGMSLYHAWDYEDEHELTICYNANGGNISGSDYEVSSNDDICYSDGSLLKEVWEDGYGHEYGLYNASTFGLHRDNYEFLGWSFNPDSGRIFGEDEALISNDLYPDITDESATIKLYARWGCHSVTIRYNAFGGTIADGKDYYVAGNGDIYNSDDTITEEVWENGKGHEYGLYNASTFGLTRKNCEFLGWSLEEESGRIFGEDEKIISNDLYPNVTNQSGTIKLYAQWGGHLMAESEGAGQTLPDGDYWISNAIDPNYLVHPDSNGTATNGTNVRMNLYEGNEWSKNDLFTVKYLGNGYYSITQSGTNMAISTATTSLRHRTNIVMMPESNQETCQWTIRKKSSGYSIQSRSNALYFDVKTDTTNNSNLQTFESNDTKSQLFSFIRYEESVPVIENPTISYISGDNCVKLTWTSVKNAEKYAVCGYINNKWQKLAEGSDTSYIVKNLKAGTEYKVAVIAMTDGEWNTDFSNAITVSSNSVYPEVASVEYNEEFHQFRIKWSAVPNAQQYGIAVKLSGKWKIRKIVDAKTTTFTSPKLTPGKTYEMVICAKVNGEWDTSRIANRTFKVTIQ